MASRTTKKTTDKTTLTADNLKNTLWETLTSLRTKSIVPEQANAIAGQAREILRATNIQIKICKITNTVPSEKVINFSND